MKKKNQKLLKEDFEDLMNSFNKTLKDRGYSGVEVKHFTLFEPEQGYTTRNRRCVEWRRVCSPVTGKCYLRCVRYEDIVA